MEIITPRDSDTFIHVPSLNLKFEKARTSSGENWYSAHKTLQSQGKRMPTIPEFVEFLRYVRVNFPGIYNNITKQDVLSYGEWLDAYFEKKGRNLFINYNHVIDKNGNLVPKNSEIIEKRTLMKDKSSQVFHHYFFRDPQYEGISLDDYVNNNHTSQGLPHKKVRLGDLNYICPKMDKDSAAVFFADSKETVFNLNMSAYYNHPNLGVYAVQVD